MLRLLLRICCGCRSKIPSQNKAVAVLRFGPGIEVEQRRTRRRDRAASARGHLTGGISSRVPLPRLAISTIRSS
jgi:hypothetical protein